MRGHLGLGLLVAAVILVADQVSKWWILEVVRLPEVRNIPLLALGPVGLDLTMVWNRGVTFGLLAAEAPWHAFALAGLAAVVVVALVVWMTRAGNRLTAIALGGLVGGAIGNVIDRVRFGAVVDFVDAHGWGWHWYVFNVADAAIVLGVVALIAEAIFSPDGKAEAKARARG